MKRIIILLGILASLAAGIDVMSQGTGGPGNPVGLINYEVKIDMHRRIPKEREAMKSMFPQFRTEKQQLFFNETESLYKKWKRTKKKT